MKLSFCLVAVVTVAALSMSAETLSAQCGSSITSFSHASYYQPVPPQQFANYYPSQIVSSPVINYAPSYSVSTGTVNTFQSQPITNYRPVISMNAFPITRPVQTINQLQPVAQSYFRVLPGNGSSCANGRCHLN